MKRLAWIWQLLVLGLIIGTMWMVMLDVTFYMDLATFLLVVVLPFLLLLGFYDLGEIVRHFKRAASQDVSVEQAGLSLEFFQRLHKMIYLSLLIPVIIGGIALIHGWLVSEVKDYISVGKGVSVAILTVIYGLMFMSLVTLPRIAALKKKMAE